MQCDRTLAEQDVEQRTVTLLANTVSFTLLLCWFLCHKWLVVRSSMCLNVLVGLEWGGDGAGGVCVCV